MIGDWIARDNPARAESFVKELLTACGGLAEFSSPSDLARVPLLPDSHWPRWFREAGASTGRLRYSGVDYETQVVEAEAAARGVGAALLSPLLFSGMVSAGKLIQPFSTVLQAGDAYHLVWGLGPRRREVRHFAGWLHQEAYELVAAVNDRTVLPPLL